MSTETAVQKTATGEAMVEYKSGARRSEHKPDYSLIPRSGMKRIAARYTLGLKYGRDNWKKGLRDPEYVEQFVNHLIEHIWDYLEDGCRKDDNLAAIAWNAIALMEAERVAAQDKQDKETKGGPG
jgi:hypothetical protein